MLGQMERVLKDIRQIKDNRKIAPITDCNRLEMGAFIMVFYRKHFCQMKKAFMLNAVNNSAGKQ